jgi:hypothetical protein
MPTSASDDDPSPPQATRLRHRTRPAIYPVLLFTDASFLIVRDRATTAERSPPSLRGATRRQGEDSQRIVGRLQAFLKAGSGIAAISLSSAQSEKKSDVSGI